MTFDLWPQNQWASQLRLSLQLGKVSWWSVWNCDLLAMNRQANKQTDRITKSIDQYTWKIFDFASNKQTDRQDSARNQPIYLKNLRFSQVTRKWKITHWVKLHKKERHSVECIPPTGWTVYILYPTDRSDLNPDHNQNQIGLFSSLNQLINLVLS